MVTVGAAKKQFDFALPYGPSGSCISMHKSKKIRITMSLAGLWLDTMSTASWFPEPCVNSEKRKVA
eukprot:4962863-Amphidinium_carterae.1